ncbi:MAG: CDP-glycerol glycerophosphotransferase family protein [Muribaculaceae bacterium]|nr:CDP-glycerol glycerophosphotransferase family protein [Muribaculaceae bacterium]
MARIFMRMLYLFPVKKNRILFSAHEGKRYNCNPKYIFEMLYEEYGDTYEYVWCISDPNDIPIQYKVKCVKFMSLRHLFYLATSAVVISNMVIEPFVSKRKDRIFINTWHGGGAYKKGLVDTNFLPKLHCIYIAQLRNWRISATDYVISGCQIFSELLSKQMHIDIERFLSIGMPRNDIFFQTEKHAAIRKQISKQYNIDNNCMFLLYAPTFRGHWRAASCIDLQFDPVKICTAIQQRFGKPAVVLYRSHLMDKHQMLDNIVDVSNYPDMQELLVAADILISDYSSSIWDYSFTYKPGFLYTPDLDDYKRDTDFHYPIDSWQYPHARSMDELCSAVLDYDESAAIARIKKHHNDLGSFETGNATKSICRIIHEYTSSKSE